MFGVDLEAVTNPFLEALDAIAVKLDRVVELLEEINSNTKN